MEMEMKVKVDLGPGEGSASATIGYTTGRRVWRVGGVGR